MFETAELGRKVSKADFKRRAAPLREALLATQEELRQASFPVLVMLCGVDGAGKGDTVHVLNEWMDPRWMVTHAFDRPTEEEAERPEFWRFWRTLPPKGRIGVLLSAWYSKPLLRRAYGGDHAEFEAALDEIVDFERHLTDDGALVIKFWLHLGKKGQEKRFKRLEKDPLQAWRVTERDWEHWRMYDAFEEAAERIIERTSTGDAPWHIVEGVCTRYASLHVGEILLDAIRRRIDEWSVEPAPSPAPWRHGEVADLVDAAPASPRMPIVLDTLDMSKRLEKSTYSKQLAVYQGRLNQLQLRARNQGISTVIVFEGWDAAGKGGVIRRINASLDSRNVRVLPIAAPNDEERQHPYLWRFWRDLPRSGRIVIFDRSWYGRVLVERVEGFASEREWRRAFAEINRFERQLVEHGILVLKYWVHITQDEQLRRFKEREQTPWKRHKLSDDDWRNRERWEDYEIAVHDMVERTGTRVAPWVLVEGNDKPYARIKVLQHLCQALEARVGGIEEPATGTGKNRRNDKQSKEIA